MLPSVVEMEAYIRQAALARGIDPDVAVRVARSEGLAPGVWQATGTLKYGRERSYGPFQLHVAPPGYRPGMGNDFVAKTGLDPADPRNWQKGVDFALDNARRGGWRPWFGAKKIGITGKMGIGGVPVQNQPPAPYKLPTRGGPGLQPQQVPAGDATASFPDWTPEPPSALGSALAGLSGLSGGPRQIQPQVQAQAPGPAMDYSAMLGQLAQPGMDMAAKAKERFGLAELTPLAELLASMGGAPMGLPQPQQ